MKKKTKVNICPKCGSKYYEVIDDNTRACVNCETEYKLDVDYAVKDQRPRKQRELKYLADYGIDENALYGGCTAKPMVEVVSDINKEQDVLISYVWDSYHEEPFDKEVNKAFGFVFDQIRKQPYF